jgi:hypothetical protein
MGVCASVGIQHAMHMRHTVICGLPRSTILPTLSQKNGTIFEKKVLKTKCVLIFFTTFVPKTKCVLIFFTTFVRDISHSKKK